MPNIFLPYSGCIRVLESPGFWAIVLESPGFLKKSWKVLEFGQKSWVFGKKTWILTCERPSSDGESESVLTLNFFHAVGAKINFLGFFCSKD